MKIKHLATSLIAAALTLTLAIIAPLTNLAGAATTTHYLAFTSDIHGKNTDLANAFTGMPENVEYVSLIGDMVGEGGGSQPAFYSQTLLDIVQDKFPGVTASNMSIIWADHDANVTDDAGIVKVDGGYNSGQIFVQNDADGNPLYYIYGIGYYEMIKGGTTSQAAAADFKTWVATIDTSIPVIVLCHVPLHAARGDNYGATYWTEALNYAATGVEDLVGSSETKDVIRDVFYFYGHNHTVDKTEYFATVGDTVDVQVDNSSALLGYSESELTTAGHTLTTSTSTDDELGTTVTATGLPSKVFFTSLVTGYIKTSGNATLMSIDDDKVSLTKYNNGAEVSLGTNISSKENMANTFTLTRVATNEDDSAPKAPDTGVVK